MTIANNIVESNQIIDLIPFTKEDGKVMYMDQNTYDENIIKQKEALNKYLDYIKQNNPLNNHQDCSKYQSNIEIIDDFDLAVKKEKSRKIKTLKSTIATMKKRLWLKKRYENRFCAKKDVVADFTGQVQWSKFRRYATLTLLALGLIAVAPSAKNMIKNATNVTTETKTKDNNLEFDAFTQSVEEKETSNITVCESEEVKLGDEILLDHVNLYYTSYKTSPSVSVRKLDCDSYKINHIAVISEDGLKVMDVLKMNEKLKNLTLTEFKNKCYSKYGENVKFQMNVDGIVQGNVFYHQAGWTALKNVKMLNKEKVYQKVR